ncbi:phage portal protein, partial [Salmonella enterica subsp. enterica serovar Poona]
TPGEFGREWCGSSRSGTVVTADKIIRLSAVWACVRLLSESVSTLPLKIYERQADGSRKLASDNPAYQVLCRRPNPEMTPSRFMLMVDASSSHRGSAFVDQLESG